MTVEDSEKALYSTFHIRHDNSSNEPQGAIGSSVHHEQRYPYLIVRSSSISSLPNCNQFNNIYPNSAPSPQVQRRSAHSPARTGTPRNYNRTISPSAALLGAFPPFFPDDNREESDTELEYYSSRVESFKRKKRSSNYTKLGNKKQRNLFGQLTCNSKIMTLMRVSLVMFLFLCFVIHNVYSKSLQRITHNTTQMCENVLHYFYSPASLISESFPTSMDESSLTKTSSGNQQRLHYGAGNNGDFYKDPYFFDDFLEDHDLKDVDVQVIGAPASENGLIGLEGTDSSMQDDDFDELELIETNFSAATPEVKLLSKKRKRITFPATAYPKHLALPSPFSKMKRKKEFVPLPSLNVFDYDEKVEYPVFPEYDYPNGLSRKDMPQLSFNRTSTVWKTFKKNILLEGGSLELVKRFDLREARPLQREVSGFIVYNVLLNSLRSKLTINPKHYADFNKKREELIRSVSEWFTRKIVLVKSPKSMRSNKGSFIDKDSYFILDGHHTTYVAANICARYHHTFLRLGNFDLDVSESKMSQDHQLNLQTFEEEVEHSQNDSYEKSSFECGELFDPKQDIYVVQGIDLFKVREIALQSGALTGHSMMFNSKAKPIEGEAAHDP